MPQQSDSGAMSRHPSGVSAARFIRAIGALLPALLIALVTSGVSAALLYEAPTTGETAIVFAPGTAQASAIDAIAAAGGKLVGPTRFQNIYVAYAPDPDFRTRIRIYGGWLTLAATGLCAPASTIRQLT